MKNRILNLLICSALLFSLIGANFTSAFAQTSQGANFVSFKDLGQQEILIEGPIGSDSVKVVLPSYWNLQTGTKLHIDMRTFVGGQDSANPSTNVSAAGYLEVYFNTTWIATVQLEKNGEQSLDFDIPDTAWILTPPNTPNLVTFNLHDSIRCGTAYSAAVNGNWRGLNVSIHPSSFLLIPHEDVPVQTDLKILPAPIYQGAFLPDKAIMVIPDQPTQGELQAAITVSSAFGRMSDGKLSLQMSTVSQLDPKALDTSNVIFVGSPANFPQLKNANLPAAISGTGFANPSIGAEDGVLQMVPSPLDQTRAWLIVSGHSDAGMIKAAQAVGSGEIRAFGPNNLAIVTGVSPKPQTSYYTDVTLEQLGYQEQNFVGYGTNYFAYYFDIPSDRKVSEGAYFELVFNNSAVVNYQESGITVTLNDRYVGGARMSDKSTSTTTAKFTVPSYFFHAGRNMLLLQMDLSGMTPCIPYDSIWISVKPSTNLHMPSIPAPDSPQTDINLTAYPAFLFPTFDHTTFVVSHDDPASWITAGKIAFDMGRSIGGNLVNPALAFSDSLAEGALKDQGFIIVGRPSNLPIVEQLKTALPAPFEAGKDTAVESASQFAFATADSNPVGYLQVFQSPYNARYVGLAVLGNGSAGLTSAGTSLITSTLRDAMNGNLAVIYNDKVIASTVNAAAPQPQATPQVVVQGASTTNQPQVGPFQIDLITMAAIVVAILVVLGLIILIVDGRKKSKG